LTFSELRELFERRGVESSGTAASDFDPPRGGTGALYPISRGALQASGIQEDLLTDEIIATQGQHHVREAISQFAAGNLSSKLLELLCCEGCIMGAGMTATLPLFLRRRCVQKYVTQQLDQLDEQQWNHDLRSAAQLPLHRDFTVRDQRIGTPPEGALKDILRRLGKPSPDDELNCGACGYETCREHAVAIHLGLAENEMCLPHTIDQLSKANQELEESHSQLASAQEALMQSEKLASMGQLAAGIAHEVNNPLGIVLMYAHLLMDECETEDHRFADIQMIAEQADRCKNIVGGLLHFARQNKVVRYPADVKELVERVVTPMRAPAGITIELASSLQDPIADLDKDQIAQVVTNLVNNAVAAIEGEGQVTVACSGDESTVEIAVTDTGSGIPKKIVKKIFEPFFTTKQAGKGTGLGLSVSYGIVKMHCGDIRVESNADADAGPTGTKFTIRLPRFE
jgi:signal transduction histidine kinase